MASHGSGAGQFPLDSNGAQTNGSPQTLGPQGSVGVSDPLNGEDWESTSQGAMRQAEAFNAEARQNVSSSSTGTDSGP